MCDKNCCCEKTSESIGKAGGGGSARKAQSAKGATDKNSRSNRKPAADTGGKR